MLINKLITTFEAERNQLPESMNDLLDFYQKKYIFGEIDISEYRRLYGYLAGRGAISAHEYEYSS
ncbi:MULTISPECIES: YppF family protein [unclassified Virgibacillus]|uniref:YppF family protein n=1 Tax=unclassified Virgibacillus TaxID=2620237 RepID=UPI0024DE18AE|nr:YppF family protein [Virgibacillus sp. LDC-1]